MIIIDIIYIESNKIILYVINKATSYQTACFLNTILAKAI
jgi:hypothetical protein